MGGRANDRYQADAQKEERIAVTPKAPRSKSSSEPTAVPLLFVHRIHPIASASSSGSEGLAPWIVGAENLDRSWRRNLLYKRLSRNSRLGLEFRQIDVI